MEHGKTMKLCRTLFHAQQVLRRHWLAWLCCTLMVSTAASHQLGLHALNNENPTGNPMPLIPELSGPFYVQMRVRFNAITENYHSLFHWTDEGNTPNDIFFACGLGGFLLGVQDTTNGNKVCTGLPLVMDIGKEYTIKFSVTGSQFQATVDNVEVLNCPSTVVPSNAARTHYLGENILGTQSLSGAILGIMVVNTNNGPPHPRDMYKFWSLPSQVLTSSGLVVSFYARFNSISDRYWQRVFDFGNNLEDDNIICTQRLNTNDMQCTVFHGQTQVDKSVVVAPGSIVVNEWAFWHFGIENNGTYWIEKDGTLLATNSVTLGSPTGIFRGKSYIGQSNWPTNDNLNGAILGLRLDTAITS